MTNIVAVAKIGKDVSRITNPNDFIFHSSYNTFKIIQEATKTITLAANTTNQSFTQAHNQRFIPLVTAYAKESTLSQVFLPNSGDISLWSSKGGWTESGVRFNYVKSDATNITFNFDNTNGGTISVTIRYFVLEALH